MNRILLALCFTLLIACKKEAKTPTPVRADISNDFSGGLNYKFYLTLEDYLEDKNAIASGKADSGVEVFVNLDAARDNEYVYFDFYTDDYSITNWTGDYMTRVAEVKQHSLLFTDETQMEVGILRRYYLGSNNKETVWRAVDVIDANGHSIWNLNSYHARVALTIKKDGTFILKEYYSNPDGISGKIHLGGETEPEHSLILIGGMSYHLWLDYPSGHPHHGVRPVKDTAILADNNIQYLVLVKEP